jgi:hypothetical protein
MRSSTPTNMAPMSYFSSNIDMQLNGADGVAQFLAFFNPDAPSVLLFDAVSLTWRTSPVTMRSGEDL